jgi:mRNA interferase HigB
LEFISKMRIVTFKKIQEFSGQHPQAKSAIEDWYHKTCRAEWNNLNDIRRSFGSTDYIVSSRFVFNIKGNNYRLVAIVIFASKKVYIRFIGTHKEYDKIDCLSI